MSRICLLRSAAALFAVPLAIALATPLSARAQTAFRSMDIDPSIRSAGMGGACEAVFWGTDPNDWANPALLGYCNGMRYEHGRTQLLPGLATDLAFKTGRTAFGTGGVGFRWATGTPWGDTYLDYGTTEGVDQAGQSIGTFQSFERVRTTGFGVSVGGLLSSLVWRDPSTRPGFLRHADVAFGMNDKSGVITLAPPVLGGGTRGDGTDWGVLLRGSSGITSRPDAPFSLDGSMGYSVLNANDERIVFPFEDVAVPLSRTRRLGVATRATMDRPWSAPATGPLGNLLLDGLHPAMAMGVAYDHEWIGAGDGPVDDEVGRWGIEMELFNVVTARIGHVNDRTGNIIDPTWGFGINLPVGRYGGIRWDHAEIPQARDSNLPNVKRNGYVVYLDPLAIAGL